MKIFILFIKHTIKTWFRKFYWLVRLSKASFGRNPKISFPVKMEGKGKVSIGDFVIIERESNIGVGKNAILLIGNNSVLESRATILVKRDVKFLIGNNFKLGENTRLYIKSNWSIGDNVKIETNCAIFAREPDQNGVLIINNGSHIGDYTIIDIVDNVTIGKDVAIGPNCTLYTHDHIYTEKSAPAWKGGLISKQIIIEDGAWVGSGVTILPGVKIGKRAVIAAGSVVTKNVEAESIYGGIPAKFIKKITAIS